MSFVSRVSVDRQLTIFLPKRQNEKFAKNPGNKYDVTSLIIILQSSKELMYLRKLQVVFRATRGSDGQGDIAVDDIVIRSGKCKTGILLKI